MEAIGKFDFTATAGDELSFKKGETIKILGTKDNWYSAEKLGMHGFVPRNYITINIPSWYKEDMSRQTAESVLISQPIGSFIIRGSQSSQGNFSISVRHPMDVQHFKVLQDSRGQYYVWAEKFNSLNELVNYYAVNSISKNNTIHLLSDQKDLLYVNPVPRPRPQNVLSPPAAPSPRPQERGQRTTDRQGGYLPSQASPRPMETRPPAQSPLFQVKALYDFEAEEKDELEFKAGDIIKVLEQSESFWWKGQLRGRTGLFPSNYITKL